MTLQGCPHGPWTSSDCLQCEKDRQREEQLLARIREQMGVLEEKLHETCRARLNAALAERDTYDHALHSLTPGGSEYAHDAKACVTYVRRVQHDQHEAIKHFKTDRDRALAEVAVLMEALNELGDFSSHTTWCPAYSFTASDAVKAAKGEGPATPPCECGYRDVLKQSSAALRDLSAAAEQRATRAEEERDTLQALYDKERESPDHSLCLSSFHIVKTERDRALAEVAVLREAGQRVMDCIASEALTGRGQPGLGAVAGLQLALTDTAKRAAAHDERVRAEERERLATWFEAASGFGLLNGAIAAAIRGGNADG